MQLIIDLSPQVSERLTQAARIRGMDPTKLLEKLVAEYLPAVEPTSGNIPRSRYKTPQEHIAAMDAIAANNADLPVLPDYAFDRENLYEDRL